MYYNAAGCNVLAIAVSAAPILQGTVLLLMQGRYCAGKRCCLAAGAAAAADASNYLVRKHGC